MILGSTLAYGQGALGLIGEFTDGSRSARFAAATPNFYLEPNESVHPALSPAFQGTWRGTLQILQNGAYEFSHEITLDGKTAKKHTLTAGAHSFELRYARPAGAAALRLQWRSAAFPWEPVPASAYSHRKQDEPGDGIEHGRALVYDAQCANCHRATGMERDVPPLAGIGSETNLNWLYTWLQRHTVIPHTAEQSADLAAYLSTLRTAATVKTRRSNEVAVGKGGELFGTLGCANCHGTLHGMGSKYSLSVLAAKLLTTHRPSMLLNEEDATALAAYLTRSTDARYEQAAPAGNSARGAEALASLGCANCHEQKRAAKPLSELRSAACKVVRLNWNEAEKQAVQAFLSGPADRSPAPVYDFPRNLQRFSCTACHKADTEAPPLEGVGEKLKTSWLSGVLWQKKRVRPGRELRMPHYSEDLMRPWIASFAKAEGLAPGDGPTPPAFPEEKRSVGVGLLGTNPRKKGMACIGCHDWGNYKSLGEEGPQLIDAAARLRFDWYERWMHNPARILSGTSMPNYFSSMPEERAKDRIHTLWAGMEPGAKAPVPDGYRTSDLEVTREAKPVPDKEAIVIRWDMPEATPAAIAVGLPGALSYCFDAGESRLLYAWRGGFLDLTGTLLKKTGENKLTPTAKLIGEIFWRSKEFPFRVGTDKRIPQRRFKGYRLVEGIPEFHYLMDGMDVFEKLSPQNGGKTILRQIRISRVDHPVFFEGRAIAPGSNGNLEVTLGQ